MVPYLNVLCDTSFARATWKSQGSLSITLNRSLERKQEEDASVLAAAASSRVAVIEWEHERSRKTMNSGKVKVRPAAEERLQRYLQRVFWQIKKKEQTTYILMNQKQYWKTTYYPYSDQKNMKINTSDIRPLQQERGFSSKPASPIFLCFCDWDQAKRGQVCFEEQVRLQLHSRRLK